MTILGTITKKGATNLGMGRPPAPKSGQCPKVNIFFQWMFSLIRVIRELSHGVFVESKNRATCCGAIGQQPLPWQAVM